MFFQMKIAVLLLTLAYVSSFKLEDAGSNGVVFDPNAETGVQNIYEDGVENGGRVKLALITGIKNEVVVTDYSYTAYILDAKVEDGPNPGEAWLTGERYSYNYLNWIIFKSFDVGLREPGDPRDILVRVTINNPAE